jgi:protein-disulfide isomerase
MSQNKVAGILVGGIVLGAVLGAGFMSQYSKSKKGAELAGATCGIEGANPSAGAIFELDGKAYAADAFPTDVRDTLFQIQSQSYETTSNFARELALRVALATEQKIDISKNLPPLKTLLTVGEVSEEDMKKFYDANKQSIPPNTTFAQIKPQLQQFLVSQKVGEQSRVKVTELTSAGRMKLLVPAPIAPVVNLPLDKFPSKGPADAKVTVVESSDYLCPHCRTIIPEVAKLIKDHPGDVRFVQANFALRPQQLSGALARGGYCAFQQGNDAFWKYHEKAFAIPMEAATPLTPDANKEFEGQAVKAAQDSGLDVPGFQKCISSEASKKAVDDQNAMLTGAGVAGTPTFFINNRKVTLGATTLTQAVQTALSTASAGGSSAK